MTIQKSWYIYSVLLYLCSSSVLLQASECISGSSLQCHYLVSLDQAGTYRVKIYLPEDGQAGHAALNVSQVGGATLPNTKLKVQRLYTESQSRPLSAGDVAIVPHWTNVILPDPQMIQFIPYNNSDNTQPLQASLYEISSGQENAFYEPTLMNSAQSHTTPMLEAGIYSARLTGVTEQRYTGIDIQGDNMFFDSVGGWLEPRANATSALFDLPNPVLVQLSVLYSNDNLPNPSKPLVDVELLNAAGGYDVIWHSETSDTENPSDLELIQQFGEALTLTSLGKVMGTENSYALNEQNQVVGLNLNKAGLTEIPNVVFFLDHLSVLSLAGNRIQNIPSQLGQLQNLVQLNLSTNRITELPAELGQLTYLTLLDVSKNKLQTLPVELWQLSTLQELYLSWNKLTELPETLSQLRSLAYLSVYYNQLTTLPAAIGQLQSLKALYAGRNKLDTLPPEIGSLSTLTVLWLQNNQLETLPRELSNLNPSTELWVWGNPLQMPTLEIARQGVDAIREYFDSNVIVLESDTPPQDDSEISIPVLGNGEVRAVLTWGALPADLDSHATGPLVDGGRFHVFFPSYMRGSLSVAPFAMLDTDDVTSYGPETITFSQTDLAGEYRYSVFDYSNGGAYDSSALANSSAQVNIYNEFGLIASVNVPNQIGNLWTVFEIREGQLYLVNKMSNHNTGSGNVRRKTRDLETDADVIMNHYK